MRQFIHKITNIFNITFFYIHYDLGMNSEIFLILPVLLLFFDLIVLSRIKHEKRQRDVGIFLALLAFILLIWSYSVLLQSFISNDFSFVGVYFYSSSGLPLFSKIYASWGGARGSMLFLSLILGAFYMIMRVKVYKNRDNFWVFATKILNIILLVFIVVSLVKNPFEQYSVTPIEGQGLNPQLQTFWMVIHPPIIFGAYAFVLLAFALTLSAMKNNRDYSGLNVLKGSVYAAWLLLSVGIALGGVWAYEVLGWGGYWAWDPVETASLLPWLFLTAMFYLKPTTKIKSFTREFMILLTFASLVFLSALTRGGGTQSVHSYAVSPVGPIMMAFAVGMIVYFFYIKRAKKQPLFRMEDYKTSVHSRSAAIIFWTLMLIAAVCFVGLAFQDFSYNYWTFPFVLGLIAGLIGYSLDEKAPFARVVLLTIGGLVAGFVVLLLPLKLHILASLGIPLILLAVLIAGYNVVWVVRKKLSTHFGRSIITLGIVLILLGVFISAGSKTSGNISDVKLNSPAENLGVAIEVTDVSVGASQSMIYYQALDGLIPEYSFLNVDATIEYMERTYYRTLQADYYPNYGLVLRPQIIGTETGDLYIHLDYTENMSTVLIQALRNDIIIPDTVNIAIQTSPMIYMLWMGIAVMILGIIAQLIIGLKQSVQN
jgi:cytochrome c-type biogenesis protein CcmF